METKNGIVNMYYKHIEEELNCKISDELLGKKYIIGEQCGVGNFSTMKIEDGLEISRIDINKTEMSFDNRRYDDDILEIGYCYRGEAKILSLPHNEKYTIEKGKIFSYKTLNDIEYFNFQYNNFKTISVHMNFNTIKNAVNPIWENKIILDWQNYVKHIFKEEILVIEKASYQMKKIAEQVEDMQIDNMLDYMKLKLKIIEFLSTFFEEKFIKSLKINDTEIISKAIDMISKNFQKPLMVKELANNLNITVYKLQEEFKNTTKCTVYEYIKKERIEKAKYLLKNTNMSVLEIANEIGYENPSKFSSAFKKYNDTTPLKYRKLNISK